MARLLRADEVQRQPVRRERSDEDIWWQVTGDYWKQRDAELAELQKLPEAKVATGVHRCPICRDDIDHPDFCGTCGDLVCPDDLEYRDWLRPRR